MKKLIVIILTTILLNVDVLAQNTSLDPFKLKLENFSQKNIKDKMEFVDKEGNEYRVSNSKYAKGVEIKNGKRWLKHGVFLTLNNGKISTSKTYDYGVLSGESLTYYSGKLNFRKNYVNNLEEGTSVQYNDKGDVVQTTEFVNGEENGKQIHYYNKKKDFVTDWVDGKRHGEVLQYNSSGKLVAKTTYNKGKRVGKTIYY